MLIYIKKIYNIIKGKILIINKMILLNKIIIDKENQILILKSLIS